MDIRTPKMTIPEYKLYVDAIFEGNEDIVVHVLADLDVAIEIADEAYDKKMDEFDFGNKSTVFKFQEYMEEVSKVCSILSCKRRYIQPYKMEPLGNIGDLFSIEDFISHVECGGFINYDGFGNYATEDQESDLTIIPTDVRRGLIRSEFTHVMWYNR